MFDILQSKAPIRSLVVGLLLTTSLLVGQLWNAVQSEQTREAAAWQTIRYIDVKDEVARLLARSTTDAEEFANFGDQHHRRDYDSTAKSLRHEMDNLIRLVGPVRSSPFKLELAALFKLQSQAIDLKSRGDSLQARAVISGSEYSDVKQGLVSRLGDLGSLANVQSLQLNLAAQSETRWAEVGAACGLVTSCLILVGLIRASRKWRSAIVETSFHRERAETELQGTKERFDRVVANLPGMAYECVLDEKGELRFTYVSEGCRDLFGIEPEQAIADPQCIFSQMVQEDVPRLKRAFTESGARRSARWIQIRTIAADGELTWLNCATRPNASPDETLRWDGIFLDDTPRQRAEQDLRQSRNFLDSVIENLPDMVFIKEARDLKFVLMNKAGEELTGFSRATMIGRSDRDFFPAEQADFFAERDRRVLDGVDSVVFEHEPLLTKNRGMRILHTKKIPLLDADGTPKFLLGISEDVTDRIRTEQALVESEQRLKAILDHATTPILLQDTEGAVILVNEPALRLLDPPIERAASPHADEFLSNEAARSFKEADRTILETRQAVEFELVVHAAEGERTLLGVRFPLLDVEGAIYAIGTIATDITDRQRAAEEIRRAKEDAEHANVAKSVFLSRMSHELRTPLNAILGFAQLLQLEPLDSDQGEMIEYILNAGHHLLGLINEVLDISRIDSGNLAMSLEPVSVNELVHEVASMIRPLSNAMEVALEIPLLNPDRFLTADRRRLTQALLNLMSNAVKYNRPNGSVTVSWNEDEPGFGIISVQDTGGGIPADLTGRLFVAFDRLGAESSGIEGTGLGLSLSQRLVEKMGGELRLKDTGPDGSTFQIVLPACDEPVDAQSANAA